MALSSTSTSSLSGSSSSNSTASFYESIYHLKKMFPKLELDIIESILRGNNSSMDETIDQLLAISIDDSCDYKNSKATEPEVPLYMTNSVNDLPPSYYELMPKFKKNIEPVAVKDDKILDKLNSILVGKLPRDFLRIKLNTEQLKVLKKSDEYKDKYRTKDKVSFGECFKFFNGKFFYRLMDN
jgi:hypothetical protein